MKKVKILYVVSRLINKGPTNQLYGIISNLNMDKYEPIILTLSEEAKNSRKQDFLDLDIQLYSLNSSKFVPKFILKQHIKKYIDRIEPDVIQTQGVRADDLISSMGLQDKHCLTLRNYAKIDYTAKFGKILGKIMIYNTYRTLNRCEYVICCSNSIKKLYAQDIDKKLYVIQNGVDTEKYSTVENSEEKNQLRTKLDIHINDKVFLVVGSMISRKDPLTIIKAFNRINNPNYKLIFLGEGPLLEKAKDITDSDNIIFRGNVNNVTEYLKASNYYISASESEGLPNSVLEAASCGLSIILSDIPQHREIFEDLSYTPYYFKIGESDKLYDIILNVEEMNSDSKSLSKEIEHYFSNKRMSKEYQNFYKKIISNKEQEV